MGLAAAALANIPVRNNKANLDANINACKADNKAWKIPNNTDISTNEFKAFYVFS